MAAVLPSAQWRNKMKRQLASDSEGEDKPGLADEEFLLAEESAPHLEQDLNTVAVDEAQIRIAKRASVSETRVVSVDPETRDVSVAPAPFGNVLDNTERDEAEDNEPLFPECLDEEKKGMRAIMRLRDNNTSLGHETVRFQGVTKHE
jgi:hypothetical protein